MKKIIAILILLLMGCSSTSLVTNWKNPDIVIFDANKVLIVGMTPNNEARIKFESKLKGEFAEINQKTKRLLEKECLI